MSVCPICRGTGKIRLPVRADDASSDDTSSHGAGAEDGSREYACPECHTAQAGMEEVAVAAALQISFAGSGDPADEDIPKAQAVDAVMEALRAVIEQHLRPRREAA